MTSQKTDHGEITEPENSTVDDWMGQRVQRDEERAERIAAETGDDAEAERRFAQENEAERPGDLPTDERRTWRRYTRMGERCRAWLRVSSSSRAGP